MFAWTYQPAYQLESTVFFSHKKSASAGLSAGFNTSRTVLLPYSSPVLDRSQRKRGKVLSRFVPYINWAWFSWWYGHVGYVRWFEFIMGPFHHSWPFNFYGTSALCTRLSVIMDSWWIIESRKVYLGTCNVFFYMEMTRRICDHKGDEPDRANWNCKKKGGWQIHHHSLEPKLLFVVFLCYWLMTIYGGVWFSII